MAKAPKRGPDFATDTVMLVVEAALPDTGNALTQSKDGDGTLRVALSPREVPEAARVVSLLSNTTFWVVIVAKPAAQARTSALESKAE